MAILEQLKSPVRLLRSSFGHGNPYPSNSVFVGHGSKWANPFKKADVAALRGEPDVEAAYQDGGWREAAKMLYVEHMREQGLDVRNCEERTSSAHAGAASLATPTCSLN